MVAKVIEAEPQIFVADRTLAWEFDTARLGFMFGDPPHNGRISRDGAGG